MTDEQRQRITNGIAAYQHEQTVLLRLLRKRGQFTATEFDKWLRGREWRRPLIRRGISGDTFLLGAMNGSLWALWLELLQFMVALGLVDQTGTVKDGIVYREMRHG